MAASIPQQQVQGGIAPNPGVLNWTPHFWDPSTTAYRSIGRIYTRGASYSQEDVVWHAWQAILNIYFPQVAANPNGISWSIEREAYRGLPPGQNPSQTKPDIIAVRLNPIAVLPGQPPQTQGRDFLWVECKAAVHDTPHGWKDALQEAAVRLNHAHSTRPLYLIIAIGWKCMFFFWDPIGTVQQRQLRIWSADNTTEWLIDAHVKGIRSTPWLNLTTGQIIPQYAMELDSWTQIQQNGQTVLRNGNTLGVIEQTLLAIQQVPLHLHGMNPASF